MNDLYNLRKFKIRPMFYALSITIGFTLLVILNHFGNESIFIFVSISLYIIVMLEQYMTSNHYHVIHKNSSEKMYDLEEHKYAQYMHHLLMPTMIYSSLVLFIYFNNISLAYFLTLILSFFIFTLLFENIHSFYKHNYSLLKSTNYIYDFITIIGVFLVVDTLINLKISGSINEIGLLVLFFLVNAIYLSMFVVRHFLTMQSIVFSFTFLIFLVPLFYFLSISGLSILMVAGLTSIIFAIFLHALSNYNKDGIDINELVEYLILALLIAVLIYTNVS